MYFKYHSVLKRHTKYVVETLSDSVLWNFVNNWPKSNCDINNCVIVHPDNIYPSDRILSIHHQDSGTVRRVVAIPDLLCRKDVLCVSNTFFYNNFQRAKGAVQAKLIKPSSLKAKFAQEIELSLITSAFNLSNAFIDKLIQGYFTLPKLIRKDDVVCVNIKCFSEECFYGNLKPNSMDTLYFKCTKIRLEGTETEEEQFCAIGETAIKQGPNSQGAVSKTFNKNKAADENLGLKPIFLLQGEEGCGKDTLLSSLAQKSGMHYIKVSNFNLTANAYAQSESKMNNVFFAAKMAAPCIVGLHRFENFGKNSEGHYDQRLISSFTTYVNNLFQNNAFPVILFCCTSSKEIPAELKRMFLEIFKIDSPNDTERELILEWILQKNDIELKVGVNLKDVASKTNGFYFEDLSALVYYAENTFHKATRQCSKIALDKDDLEKAVGKCFISDFMQSNYNESLGAPKVPKVQWSDIGGLNNVKEEIMKTINLPLRRPDLFKKSGLTRSGILLFGPPGTGKTLIAKAVATECSLCFLTVKGPELLNMYVGQSEQNIREVFERARQASPCIIFFDELDSLAPNRGLSGDSGGVMDRVVSQLLSEMDGLNNGAKVFIIGATNRPDLIDPALLRPGRFDKLLYVGPCTEEGSKVSVMQALTKKFKLASDVDPQEIVSSCPKNITGADLYGICSTAWSSAAKRLIDRIERDALNAEEFTDQHVEVTAADFARAIEDVKPSISEVDLLYFEKLKRELTADAS
ncbi:hypothetical protein YQE_04539, partial [Dendroctonus ponderosae]